MRMKFSFDLKQLRLLSDSMMGKLLLHFFIVLRHESLMWNVHNISSSHRKSELVMHCLPTFMWPFVAALRTWWENLFYFLTLLRYKGGSDMSNCLMLMWQLFCVPSIDLQAGIRSTTSTTALLGFLCNQLWSAASNNLLKNSSDC